MDRVRIGLLFAGLFTAHSAFAGDCQLPAGAKAAEAISTVAPEMAAASAPDPLCLPLEQALARLRAPAPSPTAYVPKTKDDNTPWRFDMSQNGKRMTAAEFDAWMKAKGIRVATGKPAGATPAEPAQAPPVQTGK